MLTTIDHIALAVHDLKSATERYAALFGRRPTLCAPEHTRFQFDNMALELIAVPDADHGIVYVAFLTDDLAKARHTIARRGIDSHEAERHLVLSEAATHGVRILLTATPSGASMGVRSADDGVSGLDHIVVSTSHPERAAALYGARLELRMKLDRTNVEWGARLMFFKCGSAIVEIAHSLKNADPNAPDKAWGLSWRTPDIAATHARLVRAGFNVSDVRTGRKPGTQVFTVRDVPGNVPTIVIGPAGASSAVS